MAERPVAPQPSLRPPLTYRVALKAIPVGPTVSGSWPRLRRPYQACQQAARASAIASARRCLGSRRNWNRRVLSMAGRAASNWRWASVNDSADMGDLPVWADRPRAGDGRRVTVPGGTKEGGPTGSPTRATDRAGMATSRSLVDDTFSPRI